jgi:CheY-like chemotaxis protein
MKRVLVVDDEPGVLHLVQSLLRDEGYGTRTASGAQDALESLDHEPVDLILLDLRMPSMSGWEFLDALRQREGAPPVAILSAVFNDEEIRRVCEVYGACAYISKPFRIQRLLDTVAALTLQPPRA